MPGQSYASRIGRLALEGRYLAEAAVVDALSLLARLASPRVRLVVGTWLGTLHWAVDARHRRIANDNLRLAFGDTLGRDEIGRLARHSMRHFGRLAVETLAFRRYLAEMAEARVDVDGIGHLQDAHRRGHGVIAFTGHLGHWELLAFMFGRLGMPATGIARPLDNPYLEARLVRLRTLSGNRVISKRGAFPEALAVLQQGGILGLWIDQRPKRGGIPVPFFGTDAYTTDGLARLALASQAAVVPCFAVHEADGSWHMTVEPEVPVARTGNIEADSYRLTAACTAIIERWVRRYPGQWLWTHRRWALPRDGRPGAARES